MEAMTLISCFIGVIFGGSTIWLLLRSKIDHIRELTLTQSNSEKTALQERLQDKIQEIQKLTDRLNEANVRNDQLQEQLQAESNGRSAAEEKGSRIPGLESKIEELQKEKSTLENSLSELTTKIGEERKVFQEKLEILNDAQKKFSDAFEALSAKALKNNNQSFLELAKITLDKTQEKAKSDLEFRQKAIDEMVKPVKETLDKMDINLQSIEKDRIATDSIIKKQVQELTISQVQLKDETSRLINALRKPAVRGRWGEIQLRNVVEIAGMSSYCDFMEQTGTPTEDGYLKPDMIVKLPGNKNVIVDAKVPLEAYLNAYETQDDNLRQTYLKNHAQQVSKRITDLSSKAYWKQFPSTPELVIMFLPGEAFFSAALEYNPLLIEEGAKQQVFLASPTTLIVLLRAIAYGWKQEKIAENAQQISDLGRELYKRISVFAGHMEKLGKGLDTAIGAYNETIGSLEGRVLPAARRFIDLRVTNTEEIPIIPPVEEARRSIQILETE